MIQFFKSLYLHQRFFYLLFGIAVLFFTSYFYKPFYSFCWLAVLIFFLFFVADVIALFKNTAFKADRILPDKFSNSDVNPVKLEFENNYANKIYVEIIDEIPVQFQKRDFLKKIELDAAEKQVSEYGLRPVKRGEYIFGKLNCYLSTSLKLAKRRYIFKDQQLVKVYPSFIQMKKYDFLAIDNKISQHGFKKIRRIGHTMEFEQIKEYVQGDDLRTINWKATAKHGDLMVNQYQDEKSQPIYSIIDTSRVMKMPFEGLKLVDYAINSTLAFSNIALKKNDKVGMLTYAHEIKNFLPANSKKTYLNSILETLYNIDSKFLDSDFSLLYAHIQRKITQRSLLMLYTNFEHISALRRQLPYIKAIARKHLLVVIFFENTELEKLLENKAETTAEIYEQTIAHQFKNEKEHMVKELQKHGIQTILTAPKDLTVNTINKYLEIKSRGLL
ncbi:DUF58 domain-containing protein [Mesonia aquimarina]|uniref:DUF58 domain-containing protein n=1 Tax=Mesonia aquimarina TaxID=1504967 RepID=UPI000EF6033D|nr:DUF58 domain-containing protein [Mesonia aquimarina]